MENIIVTAVFYGEKKFIAPVYLLAVEQHGPWWWRQPAYYIECEFSRLGPFYDKREAETQLEFIQSL